MCVATFRSMTYAIKAKSALDQLSIYNKIINLDSRLSKRGCSYGIEFDCINMNTILGIFDKNKIKYIKLLNNP